MQILLIEDESTIAKIVRRGLEYARHEVDLAEDGERGLEMAIKGDYALIILDLMLPKVDGWQICQELRARRRRVPILMMTARGSVPDKVRGFDIGADDYLTKPFDFAELQARVQALLRRDKIHKTRLIRIGDLEIDTFRGQVSRAGQEIMLSHREYQLLEALVLHEGQILSREMIQKRVWLNEDVYSNTVDVFIAQLRKKIDASHEVKMIQTVRGRGYLLRPSDAESAL